MIGDEEELDKYLIKIVEETSDGGIFDDMEIEISQEDDFNEENEESTEKKKITQFIEQDMFPHLGVSSTHEEKAILLGKMVRKLLLVNETSINANKFAQRANDETNKTNKMYYTQEDRDNYSNKRVETAGVLCFELFRMLYKRFIKSNINQLEKRNRVEMDVISKNAFITTGLHFSFSTGNWGVQKNNYIRTGVAQIPQNKFLLEHSFHILEDLLFQWAKKVKILK